jgi:ribosomal protein S7
MQTKSLAILNERTGFETLVRAFTRKGCKEKALKIVFTILKVLKFSKKIKPFSFLNLALDRTELRFELRVNKFSKPPKKQKGRPKLRGRIFHVSGARVRRRAVKELIRNSILRNEDTMFARVVAEIHDICLNKGITIRKKKEFYSSINNARATLEIVKRHRRRKRVNRL